MVARRAPSASCRRGVVLAAATALLVTTALLQTAEAATCWEAFSAAQFEHCQALDPTYVLYWKVDSANRSISIGVETDGDGWAYVGFGLSEAGGMRGARDAWWS